MCSAAICSLAARPVQQSSMETAVRHVGGLRLAPAAHSIRPPTAARAYVHLSIRKSVVAVEAVTAPSGSIAAPSTAGPRLAGLQDVVPRYLTQRARHVQQHFETALGADDFMQRLEVALWKLGFANDNSIAMVNLCRDEVTQVLKHKIDQIFGSSFSTHGLGGALTVGLTGVQAGLSHSPICNATGKERYVFFSFPHIAINSRGAVGNISRPGRAATSCACGAIAKSLADLKQDGLTCNCLHAGVHDPEDVELSILKQRLARRLASDGLSDDSVASLSLVQLTKVAERTITDDLETLISHAVDTTKADYAVVTGIQIHNWAEEFDGAEPNLEFVAPTSVYAVVDGQRVDLDLTRVPALPPRQMRVLAAARATQEVSPELAGEAICNRAGRSTVRQIEPPYMYGSRQARSQLQHRLESFARLVPEATPAPPATPAPVADAAAENPSVAASGDSSATSKHAASHSATAAAAAAAEPAGAQTSSFGPKLLGTLTPDALGLASQALAALGPQDSSTAASSVGNGHQASQQVLQPQEVAPALQQDKPVASKKKRSSSKSKAVSKGARAEGGKGPRKPKSAKQQKPTSAV